MDRRCGWPGTLGRHAPHKTFEVRVELSPVTGIAASCLFQSLDAVRPPSREPSAQGALCTPKFGSYAGQWDILLQMGLKEAKASNGL
jgi:hypothetical protein